MSASVNFLMKISVPIPESVCHSGYFFEILKFQIRWEVAGCSNEQW